MKMCKACNVEPRTEKSRDPCMTRKKGVPGMGSTTEDACLRFRKALLQGYGGKVLTDANYLGWYQKVKAEKKVHLINEPSLQSWFQQLHPPPPPHLHAGNCSEWQGRPWSLFQCEWWVWWTSLSHLRPPLERENHPENTTHRVLAC